MNKKKLPQVIIFGRTNVGKSTLFNCLTEKRHALISKTEGTTRDSNFGEVEWDGRKFELVDTGGIIDLKNLARKVQKSDEVDERVQQKVGEYLKTADLIIFLVNTKDGLLAQDKNLALFLKKRYKDKILLVANKADSQKLRLATAEFNKLALGEPIPISAISGSGIGDLTDIINKKIKAPKNKKKKEEDKIKICIIGKPNVGKSSLLNKMIGHERVIVSKKAHTTREPQNIKIEHKGKIIELIDTAGISKRGQKTKGLEKYGIEKSLATLKRSDFALLVLDIHAGITHQDARLIDEIQSRGTSFIILANKWDKVELKDTKKYTKYINSKFPFVMWAPIHFASALTGSKVDKILDLALNLADERKISLSDSQLLHFLSRIVKIHKPHKSKGTKLPHIYSIKQDNVNPPRFEVRIGAKDTLNKTYLRFIENRLREKYGFKGVPIKIFLTKNKRIHGKHELLTKKEINERTKETKLRRKNR